MSEKAMPPERFSLSRWSRRKLEAGAQARTQSNPVPMSAPASIPARDAATAASAPPPASPAAPELPSIDSLDFNSDFTAFFRPEVDENLKRAALKQLFRDPRFNVMDGLDTYIDDYTKADPIEPSVLKQMLERFSAVASTSSPPEIAPPSQPAASTAEAPAPSTAPLLAPGKDAAPAAPLAVAAAEPAADPSEDPSKHSPS